MSGFVTSGEGLAPYPLLSRGGSPFKMRQSYRDPNSSYLQVENSSYYSLPLQKGCSQGIENIKKQTAQMEEDLQELHEKNKCLLREMDASSKIMESESQDQFIEILNRWKEIAKNKIGQYKTALSESKQEKDGIEENNRIQINELSSKQFNLMTDYNNLLTKYKDDIETLNDENHCKMENLRSTYEESVDKLRGEKKELNIMLEKVQDQRRILLDKGINLKETYGVRLEKGRKKMDAVMNNYLQDAVASTMESLIKTIELNSLENGQSIITHELAHNKNSLDMQVNKLMEAEGKITSLKEELRQKNVKAKILEFKHLRLNRSFIEDEIGEEKRRFREINKKRAEYKDKITRWCKDFEEREGRPPTRSDKEVIREWYVCYKELNLEIKNLKAKMDESNQSVLTISTPNDCNSSLLNNFSFRSRSTSPKRNSGSSQNSLDDPQGLGGETMHEADNQPQLEKLVRLNTKLRKEKQFMRREIENLKKQNNTSGGFSFIESEKVGKLEEKIELLEDSNMRLKNDILKVKIDYSSGEVTESRALYELKEILNDLQGNHSRLMEKYKEVKTSKELAKDKKECEKLKREKDIIQRQFREFRKQSFNAKSTDADSTLENKENTKIELNQALTEIEILKKENDDQSILQQKFLHKETELQREKKQNEILKIKYQKILIENEGKFEEAKNKREIKKLYTQIDSYQEYINKLKLKMTELEIKNQVKESSECKILEEKYEQEIKQIEKHKKDELDRKIIDLALTKNNLKKETEKVQYLLSENKNQENQIDHLRLGNEKIGAEMHHLKLAADESYVLQDRLQCIFQENKQIRSDFIIMESKYQEEILKRKKLHNIIEDIKGKIRVFCRVRPLSPLEMSRGESSVVSISDQFTMMFEGKTGGRREFMYDSCFGPQCTQEEIFEDTRKLIQSAVDGYNVCIFAYGQTGSGKTYTIQGPNDKPGIAPRSISELFRITANLKANKLSMSCYMVELYLNHLQDLLLSKENLQNPPHLDIKEDAKGMTYIHNVEKVKLESASEGMEVFQRGLGLRKTSGTLLNDTSSRSHLIFSIIIEWTHPQTGIKTIGKVSFVDLAGSERVGKSGARGSRLKESRAINQSLAALGDVITSLSSGKKHTHVPYRNNKLTYLMKDSIGGNAKTQMIVNISPASSNQEETQTSLYYATRVKKIVNESFKNIETRQMQIMTGNYNQMVNKLDLLENILKDNQLALPANEFPHYEAIEEEKD